MHLWQRTIHAHCTNYIFDLLWEKYETQTHEIFSILLYCPDLQHTWNQRTPYVTKNPYDILTENLKHGALRKIFHRLASNFGDCFLLIIYHIFTTRYFGSNLWILLNYTSPVQSQPFNCGEFRHKLTVLYKLIIESNPRARYTVANTFV